MAKLDLNKVIQLALAALSLALIAILAMAWLQSSKTEYLIVAAGASSGESYVLGNALKTVVERHNPRIRISYYDRDKPSFLLAHTDLVGLFLTVGLMVGS